MSLHDHDQNPSLDEIESQAPLAVGFWLEQAEAAVRAQSGAGEAEKHPAVVAAFMAACATVYAAERQVDAADRIRDGLLAVADAMPSSGGPLLLERLAGIESELYRVANYAEAMTAHPAASGSQHGRR